MVKRREPASARKVREPSSEEIEKFASGADNSRPKNEEITTLSQSKPNPRAVRDYKAIRVPLNEFEYNTLVKVANKTGRSKLNCIRWAIMCLAEKELNTEL